MAEIHVRCPPLKAAPAVPGAEDTVRRAIDFASLISRYGEDCCFGLELRGAYYFEQVRVPPRQHFHQPMRKLFLRNAIEPILYSYKDYYDLSKISADIVNNLVSSYFGIQVAPRDSEARSGEDDDGSRVVFPPWNYSGSYLGRIASGLGSLQCPVQRSGYVFAEAILSHPYRDGNGRLGRCLSLMSLSHDLMCDYLPVPLAPVLMANNDRYIAALQDLSSSQDWEKFFSEFKWFLDEALDLAFRILDR